MMRKRYMLCLPLAAAVVALMASAAFAVAPVIDELPRVVIGSTNSFPNAVDLDAYINWFPITTTEPYGGNRDYAGHLSKATGYGSKGRFHVYVYDGTSGRTLTDGATLAEDTNLLLPNPIASTLLPTPATKDMYGVDPYTGPVKMGLTYSAVPTGSTTANVDVFAVVEGEADGSQLMASYKQMTVVTGGTANQVGYGIQLVSGRAADSFYYWIPRVRSGTGYTALPPRGRNLVDTSWADKCVRSDSAIIGWDPTNYIPSGANMTVGVYTAGAVGPSGVAYVDFIPCKGGGVATTFPVFEAKMRLVSWATAAAGSCGYRLGFMNGSATHSGYFQVYDDTLSLPFGYKGTGPGQRTNGTDFIARCFWTTPFNLTEMGDTGVIARFGTTLALDTVDPTKPLYLGADGRDYGLEIMCIAKSSTTGELDIDELSVTTLDDAALTPDTTVTKEWTGSTATATTQPINSTMWGAGAWSPYNGEGQVGGTKNGPAILLWGAYDARTNPYANVRTMGTFRVSKASPTVASGGGIVAASNTLYRTTYTVASGGITGDGNAQYSPVIYLHFMTLPSDLSSLAHGTSVSWYELFGPQATYVKNPLQRDSGALSPGVPPATAVPLRTYVYTHTLPTGTWIVLPEIAVYNTGEWYVNGTGAWGDANGYYKFTGVKMEKMTNVLP